MLHLGMNNGDEDTCKWDHVGGGTQYPFGNVVVCTPNTVLSFTRQGNKTPLGTRVLLLWVFATFFFICCLPGCCLFLYCTILWARLLYKSQLYYRFSLYIVIIFKSLIWSWEKKSEIRIIFSKTQR